MRHTHTSTYVLLELSEAAYLEISEKLRAAGYDHVFLDNPDTPGYPRIVMTGIAVVPEQDSAMDGTSGC
jgi:hypothetical protein